MTFKGPGEEYARVTRMLGNNRVEASCFDGVTRRCHIPGRLQRRVWIRVDDVVLVCVRDFQPSKGDVLLKYTPEEVLALVARDQLPASLHTDGAAADAALPAAGGPAAADAVDASGFGARGFEFADDDALRRFIDVDAI